MCIPQHYGYTPLEQQAELLITAVGFVAPCTSLWCRWAASASAGKLFIYTSYKSVSPDLQHKLSGLWRDYVCECLSTRNKTPLHKECHVDIEHIWGLSYSIYLHSNLTYSTCFSCAGWYPELDQPMMSMCFLYRFFFRSWPILFYLPLLTLLLLNLANEGGQRGQKQEASSRGPIVYSTLSLSNQFFIPFSGLFRFSSCCVCQSLYQTIIKHWFLDSKN